MMSFGFGVAGLALLSAIPVRVEGEATCPLNAPTERALERYLGASTGDALELELRVIDAAVELHLYSHGSIVLARRIELLPTACEAVPDAAALIVERFFRDLGWTPGTPDLPRPPAPGPSPSATPTPPSPATIAATKTATNTAANAAPNTAANTAPNTAGTRPPSSARAARPALHLGAELRVAVPIEIGGTAKADLSIEWFRLTFEASVARPEAWPVTRAGVELGAIAAWVFGFDLGLGACSNPTVRLCGHAFGGIEAVQGVARGAIFQRVELTQTLPRLGLAATLEWPLATRFEVVFSLLARVRPAPIGFTVEGAAEEDYTRPNLSVLLGLGFRSKIF